jgi:hypothetical protein
MMYETDAKCAPSRDMYRGNTASDMQTGTISVTPLESISRLVHRAEGIGDAVESFIARFNGGGFPQGSDATAAAPHPTGHRAMIELLDSRLDRLEKLAAVLSTLG